jgi:3-phenylpropionate/trans-cinnamate dioxygenase ferredoxin subunit
MGFVAVAALEDLTPGRARICEVEGVRIALVRDGDAVAAISSACTHAGAPFDRGRASHGAITCPVHGARFDLRSGACQNAPYDPLTVYPCRVVEGRVEVNMQPAASV